MHSEASLSAAISKPLTENAASCPLGLAINTIGGRWKLYIMRELVLTGAQRYNALLGGIAGISAKELTRNLRELKAAGLVEHVEDGANKLYVLTRLGREIEAPFRALGIFGAALAESRKSRSKARFLQRRGITTDP